MPGRRETAELVGALQSSKKDALIDTLRTTLDQARGELERSRARAEAARATEAALRDLKSQMRAARRERDEERRAFAAREEAWAARCEALEKAATEGDDRNGEHRRARRGLEARLEALGEELRRALDGRADAEALLSSERSARRDEAAALRAEAAEALRGRGEVDERLGGVALVAEQQRELLAAQERRLREAEAARVAERRDRERREAEAAALEDALAAAKRVLPVSYTHLTLPTIYSV